MTTQEVRYLLEVERQISGDDADVKQVLYRFELSLLEVAENVEALEEKHKNIPFNSFSLRIS